MLIEKHTYDNGLAIALWDIQESEEELMSLLNNDEVVAEEIIPFTSTKRRLEYLASRCALNELTGKEQRVCYHENGAPYLADNSLEISIFSSKSPSASSTSGSAVGNIFKRASKISSLSSFS